MFGEIGSSVCMRSPFHRVAYIHQQIDQQALANHARLTVVPLFTLLIHPFTLSSSDLTSNSQMFRNLTVILHPAFERTERIGNMALKTPDEVPKTVPSSPVDWTPE
jgi:hypothetical protein